MPQTKAEAYSNAIYKQMDDDGEDTLYDGKKIRLWSGSMGLLCRNLGIPLGTDRRHFKPLEDMGCIEILQRGVSSHPTVIRLIQPPTEDMWVDRFNKGLTQPASYANLNRRVEVIERRMGGVDLAAVLQNFETRLQSLESKK